VKIIVRAKFKEKGDAVPAVIEDSGFRFFSMAPTSADSAEKLNVVIDLIQAQCLDVTAPLDELKGTKPLVIYFAEESDRDDFIKAVATRPGITCKKI
jgi:hypothetical protein